MKRNLLALTLASVLSLTACTEKKASTESTAAVSTEVASFNRVSISKAAQFKTGGQASSEALTVVFFDPMCIHCANLFDTLKDQDIPVTWVPVALLSPESVNFGAKIVQAEDPKKEFEAVKTLVKLSTRPPKGSPANKEMRGKIDFNSAIFKAANAQSVPFIVHYPSLMAAPRTMAGALSLEDFIRFTAPVQQPLQGPGN